MRRGFTPCFVNYTRLAAASDKAYQLLAHGRWFSPGIPAYSTTKTGRHDMADILLKVALKQPKTKPNARLKTLAAVILLYLISFCYRSVMRGVCSHRDADDFVKMCPIYAIDKELQHADDMT